MRITTPASRLRRSDPNPRRLRAWAQRNAGGELRLGLGFCRVVSPALALTSPHEVPSIDELRFVQVVTAALCRVRNYAAFGVFTDGAGRQRRGIIRGWIIR